MKSSIKGIQMKKNLGKIFLIFILLQTTIFAKELATYKLHANKQEAYEKEAIEVTFVAQQTDHTNVMFFFVKPKKSADYKIKLLSKENKDNGYHNSTAIFRYILFPLKPKTINIDFNFKVKTSSDNGVAQAYVADHDESKGIEGKFSLVKTVPLNIKIKKLPQDISLVGDFKLKSNQYENINLHYILSGSGYNNKINFLTQIKDVNIFHDKDNAINKLTKNGYKIDRDYIYSLSAKHNFTIPSLVLKAYSPKQNSFYTLKTPSYKIKINKIDVKTILDKEESPKNKESINLQTIKQFFIYIFIFLSGYIVAKLTNLKLYRKNKQIKFKDIKASSNAKELIIVLLNNYKDKNTYNFINELEKVAYSKGKRGFKNIKKSILKEFK